MKSRPLTIFYVLICFLIIFTSVLFCINFIVKQKKDEMKNKEEIEEKNIIEYKANQTIRVRFHETDEIVAMDINDYLRGVVPAEMSPSYNIEALKAQALVARTYTYSKMKNHVEGNDADICDDFAHCQAFYTKEKLFEIWRNKGYDEKTINEYWYKVNLAVVSTQNEVIVYEGELIKAFFHASSPYRTEDISQIWGGESLPYLVSVENMEDENYENRTSIVTLKFDEFLNTLKEKNEISDKVTLDDVKNCNIYEKTISDRVKNIKIGEELVSSEKLRVIFGLKSTNFTIEKNDEEIIFHVIGYGHGVGMSQVGASTYADSGMNYKEIINHYYQGVEIVRLDD
ncbi:MAG: stage II sporulation protein D [Clostridia bacterium]|nr:stage II sporulation protein D [Clostridia bacterium]